MTKTEIPLGAKRFGIVAWRKSYGDRQWSYVVVAYRRERFKRSGRVGWRKLGFASAAMDATEYPDRKAALVAAKSEVKTLLAS